MKKLLTILTVIMAFCFEPATIVLAWWIGGEDCEYCIFWKGE